MIEPTPIRLDRAGDPQDDWLWPGRVPQGYPWFIAGRPGSGKSTALAAILASLTAGVPFPDGTIPPVTGKVIVLAHEDEPGDLRDRFAAAGVRTSRVILIGKRSGERPKLDSAFGVAMLRKLIVKHRPIAVVIDPIMAYGRVTGSSDSFRDRWNPLFDMLDHERVTPIIAAHPSMGSATRGRDPLYYIAGTAGIPELARTMTIVAVDPKGGQGRVMAWTKLQKGELPRSLAFTITSTEASNPFATHWRDSAVTADRLLESTPTRRDPFAEAMAKMEAVARRFPV